MKPARTLLAALLLAPLAALHAGDAPKPSRPMLFADYYVWYHTGDHPRYPWSNWTRPESELNPLAQKARRVGEPPFSGTARPLVGLYDSADPAVAEWHVRLAKAAGIDAFLVSWWDTVKERDRAFETGVLAAAEKLGFKIALLDERAQFHSRREDYEVMLARALRKYKESPAYLRIDGKPVVYLYQVAANPGLSVADFAAVKRHI